VARHLRPQAVRWRRAVLVLVVALGATALLIRPGAGDDDRTDQTVPPPAVAAPTLSGPSVSILAAGDILAHPEVWDQAARDGRGERDFTRIFERVRETISAADLALCHLETPLAPPDGPFRGFPRFNVPPKLAAGIASAGYDGCSTASDHAFDQGPEGVTRTLDALDQAGLGHAGTYRAKVDAGRPTIYDVNGVPVAHLSYTKDLAGVAPPAGMEWMANLIDPARVARDARAARAAGAQIVVVSMHWGTEYQHEPDVEQQTWARQVAASPDVDVILGHHTHVVQPIELVSGTWVVYGMGDHLARHPEPVNENRDGVMVRLTFTPAAANRWQVATIEALPTFVDLNPDIRVVDLERALADPRVSPGRRRIYEAAVERIQGHLLTRGADAAGLVVRGAAG
jgi:poly-gamma-glutamate synthesis protein (capsule biosynthesis protein)